MTLGSRIRSWLRSSVMRSRMESEMEAELRFHKEAYAQDLMNGGVAREEAMRRAKREFGEAERVKEECREALGYFPIRNTPSIAAETTRFRA